MVEDFGHVAEMIAEVNAAASATSPSPADAEAP
jgi:hypothetical protein